MKKALGVVESILGDAAGIWDGVRIDLYDSRPYSSLFVHLCIGRDSRSPNNDPWGAVTSVRYRRDRFFIIRRRKKPLFS